MKVISKILLFLLLINTANAGVNGLTIHSRANCVNNESISWNLVRAQRLGTNSYHYHNRSLRHLFGSGIAITRRSAAVHWNEGLSGDWQVNGEHFLFEPDSNKIVWIKNTSVVNCSIYNGWWDYDL